MSALPKVVLFDLDGTLLDSAPDMLATINLMKAARGAAPMALSQLRPHVSKGSRAMISAAFPEWDAQTRDAHVPEFLDIYARESGRHGRPFPGVEDFLQWLEAAGVRWGIVTNKPEGLARDIVRKVGWLDRSEVLIGGDSLAERKPHPLPLLHAVATMGVSVDDCVYVGDDERDIEAARAANMRSAVALWGYRLEGDAPETWGGDVMLQDIADLRAADAWP
ncbi:phosphoglycolate phosphatase [Lysobacter soyae]|uniref:phosphoglycolate phosphatase n=1 Tax=Lysobacter soyae TaxID=2764185 RepID=A0ABX8WNA0_9GAMM|nr:phosphoglycolate phosphatase [Lysobacter sp. CJ11]QYR52296.1 phosphoglycolate phosphatase [Lysobacter sp. CJ11]